MSESGFDFERVARAVHFLLVALGEDPDREGLRGTPTRSARAWHEMLSGYRKDAAKVLRTSDGTTGFEDVGGYDQMIVVGGLPFSSICEHHLLVFRGVVDVGYLPDEDTGRVVGLSKIPRLVEVFARRLQVQERMTQQVAQALDEHLSPLGVGVCVRSEHMCMSCRGVRKRGVMVTEALLGAFRKPEVRAEFWRLADLDTGRP